MTGVSAEYLVQLLADLMVLIHVADLQTVLNELRLKSLVDGQISAMRPLVVNGAGDLKRLAIGCLDGHRIFNVGLRACTMALGGEVAPITSAWSDRRSLKFVAFRAQHPDVERQIRVQSTRQRG